MDIMDIRTASIRVSEWLYEKDVGDGISESIGVSVDGGSRINKDSNVFRSNLESLG